MRKWLKALLKDRHNYVTVRGIDIHLGIPLPPKENWESRTSLFGFEFAIESNRLLFHIHVAGIDIIYFKLYPGFFCLAVLDTSIIVETHFNI